MRAGKRCSPQGRSRGGMSPSGVVLVFTLLALFLGAVIASALVFLRYQSAVAGRERALLAYNQARVLGARPLLEQVFMALADAARSWAAANMSGSGYAFGGSTQSSVALALSPLLGQLQSEADAQTCNKKVGGVDVRVHFLPTACGQALPSGFRLPPPRRTEGAPGNLETYEVPFVAVLQASLEANRRTQVVEGVLRLRAGGGPATQMQVYLGSGYQPDGSPAYFSGGEVYEGLVHVSGTPNFGLRWTKLPGPFFLAGFSTGRCTAVSASGCVGGKQPVGFAEVGPVPPESMAPSPFSPCYGASCPRFPGGVDWNAPGLTPPESSPAPTVDYAAGGSYTAFLRIEGYPGNGGLGLPRGTPVQRIDLTTPAGVSYQIYVSRDGRVEVRPWGTVYDPSPGGALLRVGGSLAVSGEVGVPNLEGSTPFTLRARGDIRILGDLLSSSPACLGAATVEEGRPVPSDCPNRSAAGVFGLYSETGSVYLASSAPPKVYLTLAAAAPNGTFGPEGYPSSVGLGEVYLQGAFLAQNYRSFLSPDGTSGWRLRFSYDPRFSPDVGLAPPGWPTLQRDVWSVQVIYVRESTP